MFRTPLVSVIIPTYNPCRYLEKSISSILSQDYENLELIIIDDKSNPSEREYINELRKKYSFKLIFLDQNSGSCARPINEGINIANGKYIGICAQDDFYLKCKISSQVKHMEENENFAMCYSDAYLIFDDNDNEYIEIKRSPKKKSGFIFNDILLQRFYIPALTVLVRKEVFATVGNFDESLLIEDWDMWLRIAYKYELGYLNMPLACYRSHKDNISKIRSDQMISDRLKIISKWRGLPISNPALAIASFLDQQINLSEPHLFIRNMILTFWYFRQPIRWLRIVFSKLLSPYTFSA